MTPSQHCLDFIAKEEGILLKAYKDSAGVWTIGIGTIMYDDGRKVKEGDVITKDRAIALLKWEVDLKAAAVRSAIKSKINQNQFDALVSFTYNEGVGALNASTLVKKVNANPADPSIRDEFNKWVYIHVNGKPVKLSDLVGRRKREADLYFS